MKDIKIVYKGKKRPLIYISNFGDVYLNDGDVLTITIDSHGTARVYKQDVFNYKDSGHRYMCYLSNLMHYEKYGFLNTTEEMIEIFKEMLLGNSLTDLEFDLECIQKIAERLPKKDIVFVSYNFSNQYRPTHEYTYKEGLYNGSNINNKPAESLAWYVYRNAFRLLPDGVTEINAKDFEKLGYLYEE